MDTYSTFVESHEKYIDEVHRIIGILYGAELTTEVTEWDK